jgi:response regulator RpfG family c-di-GMP phosphodiesterase
MTDTILLVDDEPQILKALTRVLRKDDYEILTATSGADGLEAMSQAEVALLVSDQCMPGMSGSEFLAKAAEAYPDTYRITLTGQTDLASAQSSINEGRVDYFLLKPWEPEFLRSVIGRGVQEYHRRLDHRRLTALTEQQRRKLAEANQHLEKEVEARTEELTRQNAELREMRHRLEGALHDTVRVLSNLIEVHSPNAGLHAKRVAEFALVLGKQVNLPQEALTDLEFAALLHDIGIFAKRNQRAGASRAVGPEKEAQAIAVAEAGFTILSHVTGFETVAQTVRHQYEHHDGTGAPDGFREDEIPISSRIIAIANAFDEAVHGTDNPALLSYAAGRRYLTADRGKHFDPFLVKSFLAWVETQSAEGGQKIEVELSPRQLKPEMVLSRAIYNVDGVLLTKPGTALTLDMIERIRRLNAQDPMLSSVYIRCQPDLAAKLASEGNDAPLSVDDGTSLPDGSGLYSSSPQASTAPSDGPSSPDARTSPPSVPLYGMDILDDPPDVPDSPEEANSPEVPTSPEDTDWSEITEPRPTEAFPAAASSDHNASSRAAAFARDMAAPLEQASPNDLPTTHRTQTGLVTPTEGSNAAPRRSAAPPGSSKPTALIVDDDPCVCGALARELRRAGFTSRCAHDGRDAQNLLDEEQFDIVLIDVAMPVMTGDLLVAHIQQCWPDQPCIILTGHATRQQILRIAQASNVARILAKPWDAKELIDTIHSALGRSPTPATQPAPPGQPPLPSAQRESPRQDDGSWSDSLERLRQG